MALLVNTTFNYPAWTQSDGLSDAVCSGAVDGVTGNGSWTASPGAVEDQFTSAANMAAGGGGLGFRHWLGDGLNNVGGGIVINFTASAEVWIRYYIRYASGFTWGSRTANKSIYVNRGQGGTFYFGPYDGVIGAHVEVDSTDEGHGAGNRYSSTTWATWQGGSTGDGLWHCLEVHAKMNSAGATSDGELHYWLDGTQIYARTNVHFSDSNGSTFSDMAVGENADSPLNGAPTAVDYDDIAVSNSGYIGTLAGIASGRLCVRKS